MSKIQDEIFVDFNLSKKEINKEESKEVKPKAKRASKTNNNIIVEDIKPVDPVEPVEDIEPVEPVEEELKPKTKPKRINKKNVVPIEEPIEEPNEEPNEEVIKPKPKRTSK